jgi:hypothetical protein
MSYLKILDRYYARLYKENRDKFLAKFPYTVIIDIASVYDYEPIIVIWLKENVGRLDKDYRIQYNRTTNIYCFKKQEDSITFALRWM